MRTGRRVTRADASGPLRAGLAAGLASGVLLWAAAPPVGLGWLAWIALVPAAAVVLRWPGTSAGRLAVPLAYAVYLELLLVPALPFGLAEGQWGDAALPVLTGGSPVLVVALLAVPAAGVLLYLLRFGQAPGGGRAGPLLWIAVPALSWTALDFVRANLDPGGLWGPLFLSQHDRAGAALAVLGGPWLVTFAIVAVSYGLALALVRRRRALAAAAAAAALAAGALPAALVLPDGGGRAVTVAAVQPGYDTAEEDRPALRHFEPGTWDRAALDTVRDLAPLTRAAARRGAQLVAWPEASLYVDPRRDRRVRRALVRLARSARTALVVPYFLPSTDSGAALLVDASGRIAPPRPKRRAMWFLGERAAGSFVERPEQSGGAAVGTMLGVDGQDPDVLRSLRAGGARVAVWSSHDWRQLAPQHAAFVRLAAAGAATPVVRADWRYGSAIYTRAGEVVDSAGGELRRTVAVARVRLASGRTPWTRVGDLVGWLALAGVVATGASAAARRRPARARGRAPAPASRVRAGGASAGSARGERAGTAR